MYDEDGKVYEESIFQKNFRRGHYGLLDEAKRERKNQTKNMKAYVFGGDNTDWKVNAVVDEDELFNESEKEKDGSGTEDTDSDDSDDDDVEKELADNVKPKPNKK